MTNLETIFNDAYDWANHRFRGMLATLSVGGTAVDATHPLPTNVYANGDALLLPNVWVRLNALDIGSIATAWTPTSGKKVRLMGGSLTPTTAISILFEDNAAGAGNYVISLPTLVAGSPYTWDMGNGKLLAAANNVLKATGSGAGLVTGYLYGREE